MPDSYGPSLAPVGRLGPKAREPATDAPANAPTTTISSRIGRYCSTGAMLLPPRTATASQDDPGDGSDRRKCSGRHGGCVPFLRTHLSNRALGREGGSAVWPERPRFLTWKR